MGTQNFHFMLAPQFKVSPERTEPTRCGSEGLLHLCPIGMEGVEEGAPALLSAHLEEN